MPQHYPFQLPKAPAKGRLSVDGNDTRFLNPSAKMDFDIPALIWDQAIRMSGWRFYVCVAVMVAAIYFFFGWTNVTISIAIVVTLVGTLSGVLWQYLHEREQ